MRLWVKIVASVMLLPVVLLAAVVIHANVAIASMEIRSPSEGAPGRMMTIGGRQWHVLLNKDPQRDPTGAPILLVHGFAVAGAQTFQPWASTQLGDRSLILPDLLGYGHSQRIPISGPWYALKSYSDGLAAMLDKLGVAQVDLVGHSYGGAVVAQFALDHPDRVRRIVFIDAGIYVPASASENIIQLPLGIGRAVAWHGFGGGPWSINALVCKQLGCTWGDLARVTDTTDTLRAMMRSHRAYIETAPLIPRVPQLGKPALVIWGEQDPIVPLSDGVSLARETSAPLLVFKGAGHLPHLGPDSQDAGNVVRNFLGKSTGR